MTYDYPKSIKEAVALLDKVDSGWRKKVNLSKLAMDEPFNCILGQLYGSYETGMIKLFGHTSPTWVKDDIFGIQASNKEWKKEIKMSEPVDFYEALEAIKNGHHVQIINRTEELYRKGDQLCSSVGGRPYKIEEFFDLYNFKYVILPKQLTFADLKVGDKFHYLSTASYIMTKIVEGAGGYNCISENYTLGIANGESLVKKV